MPRCCDGHLARCDACLVANARCCGMQDKMCQCRMEICSRSLAQPCSTGWFSCVCRLGGEGVLLMLQCHLARSNTCRGRVSLHAFLLECCYLFCMLSVHCPVRPVGLAQVIAQPPATASGATDGAHVHVPVFRCIISYGMKSSEGTLCLHLLQDVGGSADACVDACAFCSSLAVPLSVS
jgi:hypothetical protein